MKENICLRMWDKLWDEVRCRGFVNELFTCDCHCTLLCRASGYSLDSADWDLFSLNDIIFHIINYYVKAWKQPAGCCCTVATFLMYSGDLWRSVCCRQLLLTLWSYWNPDHKHRVWYCGWCQYAIPSHEPQYIYARWRKSALKPVCLALFSSLSII